MTRYRNPTAAFWQPRHRPPSDACRARRDGSLAELHAAELRGLPLLTLACIVLGMVVTVAAAVTP